MRAGEVLGYADSDIDVALTDAIAVLNNSCIGCDGLCNFSKCVECPTERTRQSLVVDATIQLHRKQVV